MELQAKFGEQSLETFLEEYLNMGRNAVITSGGISLESFQEKSLNESWKDSWKQSLWESRGKYLEISWNKSLEKYRTALREEPQEKSQEEFHTETRKESFK